MERCNGLKTRSEVARSRCSKGFSEVDSLFRWLISYVVGQSLGQAGMEDDGAVNKKRKLGEKQLY